MKIILFIFIVLICINLCQAYVYNVNYSQLPLIKTENILLFNMINETVNIIYSNHTYGNNNFNISDNFYYHNITLNITQTNSNNYYSEDVMFMFNNSNLTVSFIAFIQNDTKKQLTSDSNSYEYQICDFLFPLRFNNTLKLYGDSIPVTTKYDNNKFSLTSSFTVNNIYESKIEINAQDNINDNITFIYGNNNITINYKVNKVNCYDEQNDIIKTCSQANLSQELFSICIRELNNLTAKVEYINQTVEVNITREYRIPVWDLDNDNLTRALIEFPNEWQSLKDKVDNYDVNLIDLQNKILEKEQEKQIAIDNNNEKWLSTMKVLQDNITGYQNKQIKYEREYVSRNIIIGMVCLILFGVGIFFGIKAHSENNFY